LIIGCLFCFIICRKNTSIKNENIAGKQNSAQKEDDSMFNILYTDANGNISAEKLQSNKLVQSNSVGQLQSYTEAGMISYFAMETPPTGWLVCDGASYSISVYPDLAAAIGIIYGGSSGIFNVPNLQGYFIRGYDPTGSIDTDRNKKGFGVVQNDLIKNHNHYYAAGTGSGGASGARAGSVDSSLQTLATSGNEYGSESRPKNIAMLACIKT
jgi:microcystin-dependent protein